MQIINLKKLKLIKTPKSYRPRVSIRGNSDSKNKIYLKKFKSMQKCPFVHIWHLSVFTVTSCESLILLVTHFVVLFSENYIKKNDFLETFK